jgi:hypothetical protein
MEAFVNYSMMSMFSSQTPEAQKVQKYLNIEKIGRFCFNRENIEK